MKKKTLKLSCTIHARPSALIAKTAAKYSSDVFLSCNNRRINAKSAIMVLSLGVSKGSLLEISVSGTDESEALSAIYSTLLGISHH